MWQYLELKKMIEITIYLAEIDREKLLKLLKYLGENGINFNVRGK